MMNRMARKLVLVLAMAAAWLTSPAQAQVPCRYEVTHIIQGPSCGDGFLPTTVGMGISPNGQYVCGYYQCIINTAAFVYDTQTRQFITIPVPVSAFTKAFDVNDAGVVVGTAGIASGNYGFIYNLHTGQVTHQLSGAINNVGASIAAINALGMVCGTRTITGAPDFKTSAFIWTPQDGFTDLGLINGQSTSASDINDGNAVAGTMIVSNTQHPFLWKAREFIDAGSLAGIGSTVPLSVNNSSQIVGYGGVPMDGAPPWGVNRPFVWSGGSFTQLSILPAHLHGFAQDSNNAGLIVGHSRPQTGPDHAVLWWNGQLRELNELIDNESSFAVAAYEILEDGRILASGYNGNTISALILAPSNPPFGDINSDCRVNVNDLLRVINDWGQVTSPADLDRDGLVGLSDLVIVVTHWAPFP